VNNGGLLVLNSILSGDAGTLCVAQSVCRNRKGICFIVPGGLQAIKGIRADTRAGASGRCV